MSAVYDNWERLVQAALLRDKFRFLARADSLSSTDSGASSRSDSGDSFRRSSPLSLDFSNLGFSFTYQQILQATSSFSNSNFINRGRSGDFFLGILEGGAPVVVKRVDLDSSVKKEAYLSELDLFSKASHARLIPFLGHCLEYENEKYLVYKYMPNADLSTAFFTNSDVGLQSLDWITRLKIAIGVAEGLIYLHHECSPPLVHGDIQASSILLDDKFEVRLGSLSEVCAQEGGSLSEVYAQEGGSRQNRISRFLRLPRPSKPAFSGIPKAWCAYDTYCFGKVLLELVTGKLGISSSSPTNAITKRWLDKILPYISTYYKELVMSIIEPSLIIDEDLVEEVWAMAIVAKACLNPDPTKRPKSRFILKALENPMRLVREYNNEALGNPINMGRR